MKRSNSNINLKQKGVTLIELTVVITVMIALISTVTLGVAAYRNWQRGLEGGEAIKAVYQAQRLYLADNPTKAVGGIVFTDISSYMPDAVTAADSGTAGVVSLPNVTDPAGGTGITVNIQVSPPVMNSHTDISNSTTDGLWDAGK